MTGPKKGRFSMKKLTGLISLVLILSLLFTGCAKAGGGGGIKPTVTGADQPGPGPVQSEPAKTDPGEGPSGTGGSAADSYSAYLDAKNEVITRLSDAISFNPDAGMPIMFFFGVTAIDLAMWPAAFMGQDEEAVKVGMSFLGIQGIKYDRSGNKSKLIYKDGDGKELVFTGQYDDKADAGIFENLLDGKEALYAEYHKTPYGYVAQYFMADDDGMKVYRVIVDGKDGGIGLIEGGAKPSPLTGKETWDFLKEASEWYTIKGNRVTGIGNEGQEIDIEISG